MTKRISMISALLFSSALYSPALLAQAVDPSDPAPEDSSEQVEEEVDISAPGSDFSGDIIVRGKFIPEPIRNTAEVVAVLGTEEIARTAEGDIAGSLSRVTGLSVVSGRFVFVRGLGERYSLALLNGSPLPSPEPLRRVVPLDLFPTSVIASTVVQKSYSVNYPGEFGGGVINLTTKSTPDEPFLSFSAGISADTETTNKLGYTYYGSDTDWSGYDGGARRIPDGLAAALAQNVPVSEGVNFTADQLKGFAQSLNNAETNLIQRNFNIPANFSAEISGGTGFDVGSSYIGVVATAGYSNSWRTRGGNQQLTNGIVQVNGEDALLADQDFQFLSTENRIVVNGLIGLSAEIGEHKLRFTNLYIHDTSKEASIKNGFNFANVGDIRLDQGRTSWFERQLFSSQFAGEFKFDPVSLDVRASYANSKRDAPYERSYSYAFDRLLARDFVNDLTSPGQEARISFSSLNDNVYGASADLGYELPTGIEAKLSAGYNYYLNERTASRRDFRFLPDGSIPPGADQVRIDYLLSDAYSQVYGVSLVEQAAPNTVPAYDARLEVHAGYMQIDAEVADALRVNVGVRYEEGKQSITPITLTGGFPATPTSLNNEYWLPAATVTWNFADDMQLRFAASKTIARPQFRELAPQQYLDLESDRTYIGNPALTDSELLNFEARYEYYIGRGERVTLAGFYKQIDNPIDNVAFRQGDSLFTTFANAPKATLYGIEAELVKIFPLDGLGNGFLADRQIMLAANYTYTQSKIKVGASDMTINPITLQPILASNLFDDGDRLTGQSDHVANLQIGLERSDDLLSQQTILLTYNSPRVTNRGPNNQPDLIEKTGVRLDFVMREQARIWGQDLELKFEARNLLGTGYSESQTLNNSVILNNSYDVGHSFSFGVTLKF